VVMGPPADSVDEMAADRGVFLGVVARNQHGDPRVALHILVALAQGHGVDEQILAVGVDPGVLRLGLCVGHERDDGRQVRTLGQADDVVSSGMCSSSGWRRRSERAPELAEGDQATDHLLAPTG
jgi:hypothetical protein